MQEKVHDVFIAYHGTYDKNGTSEIAHNLCKHLTKKGLNVYHFPNMNRDNYKANPGEVRKSKTFVLIVNKCLHTKPKDGSIDLDHHLELFREIDEFNSLTQSGDDVCVRDATVLCVDFKDEERGSEQKIHHLFQDRTHFYIKSKDSKKFDDIYKRVKSRLSEKQNRNNPNPNQTYTEEIKKVFGQRVWMAQEVGLPNLVLNSKTIRCLGISNSEMTTVIGDKVIKHALDHGATIEILFLDPNGEYTPIREKEEGYKEQKIKETTEEAIKFAKELKKGLPQKVQKNYSLSTYDMLPRINLIILDRYAILQHYANNISGMYNPCFFIERNEDENFSPLYKFCETVFNHIKKHKSTTSLESKDNLNSTN